MTIQPISESRIQDFEYSSKVLDCRATAGTTIKDVISPEYWLHCAYRLRPLQEIRIISEDLKWYARLLVGNVVTGETKGTTPRADMMVIDYKDFSAKETLLTKSSEYFVQWQSPATKYCIFSMATGDVFESGFETEQAANEMLEQLVKALAA